MSERGKKVKVAEYGAWSSPISADIAAKDGGIHIASLISDVHTCYHEEQVTVFWSELRLEEGGRTVVCSWNNKDRDAVCWTPEGFNARTRVHEYGGAATLVHNGSLYFSNFDDQLIYKQESPSTSPQAITPDGKAWRYADGELASFFNKIICVREDHELVDSGEENEAKNTIVSVDPETQEQHVLVEGADFYSSPRVSSTGMLAWVQWNHPNMPWDTVKMMLGKLDDSGTICVSTIFFDEGVNIMHPRWTAEDSLLFITDKSDWWNLYEYISETGEERNLYPVDKEIGEAHWIFGYCAYCPHPKQINKVAVCIGEVFGILDTNQEKLEEINTGFDYHSYPKYSPSGDKVYCIAGSTAHARCIIEIDVETKKVVVIKDTTVTEVDVGYISEPKAITFPTEDNKVSHGYLYLPKNKDYAAPPGTLPPLIVQVHGGPTLKKSPLYNLGKQFFTSRGVAIFDVNYRGSTGYGMHYRRELTGKWGKLDVEDVYNGALYVANTLKVVDANRLCLSGISGGGFTSLRCLVSQRSGPLFKAACSQYAPSYFDVVAEKIHKFQSHYLDLLIAPYPEGRAVFIERSPLTHVDKLNHAIVFFHGDEDKVVPPSQSEKMFEVIKKKGLPCCYVLCKGDGHSFTKMENIITSLEGEFCFFAKVLGYEPADFTCKLDIHNLKS